MGELKLYTIDREYIRYLQKAEKQVINSDEEQYVKERPYVGIVLEINGFNYFAPLSSPKASDYLYKDGKKMVRKSVITIIRLVIDRDNLLGKIKLNNMIPVPKQCLKSYNLNLETDLKYKGLLEDEIICIRKAKKLIMRNAKILYHQKAEEDKASSDKKYLRNTMDFKKVEGLCRKYEENKKLNI